VATELKSFCLGGVHHEPRRERESIEDIMGLMNEILGSLASSVSAGGQGGQNPLGSILGSLGGGNQSQSAGFLAAAMSMLQQQGGISNVLDMFRRSGMGQHADSWMSNGPNLPVSGDQVRQVFGASSLEDIASRLGISHGQASSAMAQILPELINQMTPNGQLPQDHHDLLSQALAMMRGFGKTGS
jgi:uncharacterized protein YidB (DUF937 family)